MTSTITLSGLSLPDYRVSDIRIVADLESSRTVYRNAITILSAEGCDGPIGDLSPADFDAVCAAVAEEVGLR